MNDMEEVMLCDFEPERHQTRGGRGGGRGGAAYDEDDDDYHGHGGRGGGVQCQSQ